MLYFEDKISSNILIRRLYGHAIYVAE